MKKEIIKIDEKKGIFKVTTTDERFYSIPSKNPVTGLPEYHPYPSVTWITGYVYKGIGFYKWLAEKGWDEAEAIKAEAGDKGSKIHQAIEQLINGATVGLTDKFYSPNSDSEEELKPEEYAAVMSFKSWYDETKPEFILQETTVISEKYNFAGTVDCVCKIGDQVYILDWKTSQYVWPSMEAQLSAYKQALKEMGRKVDGVKLAILQLGYRKNKKNFKFTEVEDQFEDLFIPAQKFWQKENKDKSPKQAEYPLSISLNLDLGGSEKKETHNTPKKPVRPTVPSNLNPGDDIVTTKSNKLTK